MRSLGVHLASPIDTVQSVLNAHFIFSQSWTPIVDLDYIAGANIGEWTDSLVNTTQDDVTDQITAHFLNAYLLGTKLASPAFRLYPDDPFPLAAYCICGPGRNTPTNHYISTSSVVIPPGRKSRTVDLEKNTQGSHTD